MASMQVGSHTVEVTHEERVLFPEDGLTKGDLIAYYRSVAPTMLPHLRGRPLHLQRFPRGIGQPGFVQKEAPDHWPEWVVRARVPKEGGHVVHAVCDNAATLIFLANQDCITPHVWLSREGDLLAPDHIVLDLDPPDSDFVSAKAAAQALREMLESAAVPAFVATTGSRGLHVAVPIVPGPGFDQGRALASAIAEELARHSPGDLTTEQRKEERKGRLYVDTMRNAYAQTVVAPYAVRPRPGAPVATPLEWEELADDSLRASTYTVRNLVERLRGKDDPWRAMAAKALTIEDIARRLRLRLGDAG